MLSSTNYKSLQSQRLSLSLYDRYSTENINVILKTDIIQNFFTVFLDNIPNMYINYKYKRVCEQVYNDLSLDYQYTNEFIDVYTIENFNQITNTKTLVLHKKLDSFSKTIIAILQQQVELYNILNTLPKRTVISISYDEYLRLLALIEEFYTEKTETGDAILTISETAKQLIDILNDNL